uniref:Uncharacterized protein n=1 Tax=viral metagenome TaxID=1070528 RepID=A0A6M3L2F1_9ZZZZ
MDKHGGTKLFGARVSCKLRVSTKRRPETVALFERRTVSELVREILDSYINQEYAKNCM